MITSITENETVFLLTKIYITAHVYHCRNSGPGCIFIFLLSRGVPLELLDIPVS